MRHHLGGFVRALVVLLLVLSTNAVASATDFGGKSLDELFVLLKDAPDETTAASISDSIWQRWTEPGEPGRASLMAQILEKRREFDLRTALDLANELIATDPDYAEGWNQRATLEYMHGNYQASLADIAETLKREPRHFGALAGKAVIQMKLGDEEGARRTVLDAIAINPFLPERGLFPDLGPPPTRT